MKKKKKMEIMQFVSLCFCLYGESDTLFHFIYLTCDFSNFITFRSEEFFSHSLSLAVVSVGHFIIFFLFVSFLLRLLCQSEHNQFSNRTCASINADGGETTTTTHIQYSIQRTS